MGRTHFLFVCLLLPVLFNPIFALFGPLAIRQQPNPAQQRSLARVRIIGILFIYDICIYAKHLMVSDNEILKYVPGLIAIYEFFWPFKNKVFCLFYVEHIQYRTEISFVAG